MAEKKHWMKQAFEGSHGQFKAKAEHAGKSTSEFAHEHEGDKGKLGKQARLAEVGMKAHHKRKAHQASPKRVMNSFYGHKG